MAHPTPSNVPPAPEPAYAAAPRRSGLLYAIAGIVALAAAAALAIFMLGGRGTAPPVAPTDLRGAGGEPPKLDSARATLDAASKSVLNPAPATSPVAEPPPAVVAAGSSSASPPPMPAAEPPRAAAPAPATRPAPAATPAPAPKVAAAPQKSAPPPPAAAPAAVAPAAVAPPAQVAAADRWSQMRDEMGRCSSSSVIPRIQCERRIRAHYCDGYWGTVPDCPTGNRRS